MQGNTSVSKSVPYLSHAQIGCLASLMCILPSQSQRICTQEYKCNQSNLHGIIKPRKNTASALFPIMKSWLSPLSHTPIQVTSPTVNKVSKNKLGVCGRCSSRRRRDNQCDYHQSWGQYLGAGTDVGKELHMDIALGISRNNIGYENFF